MEKRAILCALLVFGVMALTLIRICVSSGLEQAVWALVLLLTIKIENNIRAECKNNRAQQLSYTLSNLIGRLPDSWEKEKAGQSEMREVLLKFE